MISACLLLLTVFYYRKYLSDPTDDVRVATEGLLADFLREIREVTIVQRRHEEQLRAKREATVTEASRRAEAEKDKLPDITMDHHERATFIPENDDVFDNDLDTPEDKQEDQELRDSGGKLFELLNHCRSLLTRHSLGTWSGCTDRLCGYRGDSTKTAGRPT